MPQNNMYTEVSANTNLKALADIQGINNITATANGILQNTSDAGKRARRVEYFYDQMLLDTIRLGSENNVFLKYCRTKTVPSGNEKFLLRRWGGLTEHTQPLAEGIPPKSDGVSSESFEGTYCQYGRYMEFTDRVEFNLIDDIIAHYSMEMGDLAVRTAERLCREELIANAGEIYPSAKSFSTLVVGDTVGIEDYRLQALKFARRLVKPLNGNYVVICSPEHIYDLVDDDLVQKYMEYTNTAESYITGKPVKLFNLSFEETMLDDFGYGYTEVSNPGEYEVANGSSTTKYIRLVITNPSGELYYINLPEHASATSASAIKRIVKDANIADGSYIPNLVKWDLEGFKAVFAAGGSTTLSVTKQDGTSTTLTYAVLKTCSISQLPVHRSFMFGDEFIYKTGIDGRMNAKFFVKAKGSAGVLDPIDQRQSVGFKIDTLGFNTVRPEAMVQFIFVPSKALITYNEVVDEYNKHFSATGHVHHD